MSTSSPIPVATASSVSLGTVPPTQTMAQLLHRLGDIPLDRIRTQPYPGSATVADAVACKATQNCLCELVDGVLVEKAMSYREGLIAGAILEALRGYNRDKKLGKVTPGDSAMQIAPNLVRLPDVGFAFWDRFPESGVTDDPAPLIAPDVAVEVLSPSNTRREMERKRAEYFAAGTQVVWIVDIQKRTVTIFSSADQSHVLQANDVLDGGMVLPGFRLPLQELFFELDEKRPAKS